MQNLSLNRPFVVIEKLISSNNILKQAMENPQYALSLVEFEKANIIKESIEKEIAEEAVDRFVPHCITINGELYAVGVKDILNLRNGDIFLGGRFSPLVLPASGTCASRCTLD